MRAIFLVPLLALAVAGCGGGGGSDNSTPPPGAQGPLAKYVGTYSVCEGNERITLTVTANGGSQLSLTPRSDYYQTTGCTGAVVGVETLSSPLTASYVSTGAAQVTGWPAAASVATYTVDRLAITAPATTWSLTGSGVTTINGRPCVRYTNGQTCLDAVSNPALSTTGGLAFADSTLLLLNATAAGYARDTAYQRQ